MVISITPKRLRVVVSEDTHTFLMSVLKTAKSELEIATTPQGSSVVFSDSEVLLITIDEGCNVVYTWLDAVGSGVAFDKKAKFVDPSNGEVFMCVSPLHALTALAKTPRTLLRSSFVFNDWIGWRSIWACARSITQKGEAA